MKSAFLSYFISHHLKNAGKFSAVFWVLFGLWSCDQPGQHQPQSGPAPDEQVRPSQPGPSAQQLIRGVYSAVTLSLADADNDEKADFLRDLLEGLVIYDRQGHIVPAAAERWETKDNKIWRFYLRDDAKWSNGEPVNAQDFVYSWRMLTHENTPLKQYLSFMNLANAQAVMRGEMADEQLGVRALDDKTLEIALDKATPYLPQMLAHAALLPMKYGKRNEFIGNGAYRYVNAADKQQLLEKNPYYWNADRVSFEQVVYRQLSPGQAVNAIDWVVNPADKAGVNQQFPSLCTYFYEFNLKDPALGQSAVRSALVSMISAQGIVQNEELNETPVNEFLPRHMLLDDNPDWQASVVEQLLQQAGFSESKPLSLKVTYDQDGNQENIHAHIAQRLARAWSQSDLIRASVEPVSWQRLQEKRQTGDFQVIRSGWCADYNEPSAFLQLLQSQHPDNKTGFRNKTVDQLLAQSLQAKTEAERAALYRRIEGIAKQERVFLPIFQYRRKVHSAPSLAGFDVTNPTGVIYSKDLRRTINPARLGRPDGSQINVK